MKTVSVRRLVVSAALLCTAEWPLAGGAQAQTGSAQASAQGTPASPVVPGAIYTPGQLTTLLPPSVYFQGRTAPLQLRNASATSFGSDAILWVSLVDSSGYASSVQERYQFYLVTESPLKAGHARIPAGAYGGGFVGDHLLLMDLGGHTVAQAPIATDAALKRPRPLQLLPSTSGSVKLYLGRRWVELSGAPAAGGNTVAAR